MSQNCIVFCDTSNQSIDKHYAKSLRAEFRRQTGWKVEKNTPIWDNLTKFSLGYSVKKRNVSEVVTIFRIAEGLLNIPSTAKNDDCESD